MAELKGGTTIAGYTAIHSGLKEVRFTGNIKLSHPSGVSRLDAKNELRINTGGAVFFSNEVRANIFSSIGNIWWNNGADNLNDLKTSVENGRVRLATAITEKGVAASGNETLPSLATKIGSIKTGYGLGDVIPLNKMENHYGAQFTKVNHPIPGNVYGNAGISRPSWHTNENYFVSLDTLGGWFDDDPDNFKRVIEMKFVNFQTGPRVQQFTIANMYQLNDGDPMSMEIGIISFPNYSYAIVYSYARETVYCLTFKNDGTGYTQIFERRNVPVSPISLGYSRLGEAMTISRMQIYLAGKPRFTIPMQASLVGGPVPTMATVTDNRYADSGTYYHNTTFLSFWGTLNLEDWLLSVPENSEANWRNGVPSQLGALSIYRGTQTLAKYNISYYIWDKYYSNGSNLFLDHNSFVETTPLWSNNTRFTRKTINNMAASTESAESITTHWTVDIPTFPSNGIRKSNTEIYFLGQGGESGDTGIYLMDLTNGLYRKLSSNMEQNIFGDKQGRDMNLLGMYQDSQNENDGSTSIRSLVTGFDLTNTLHRYNHDEVLVGYKITN